MDSFSGNGYTIAFMDFFPVSVFAGYMSYRNKGTYFQLWMRSSTAVGHRAMIGCGAWVAGVGLLRPEFRKRRRLQKLHRELKSWSNRSGRRIGSLMRDFARVTRTGWSDLTEAFDEPMTTMECRQAVRWMADYLEPYVDGGRVSRVLLSQ